MGDVGALVPSDDVRYKPCRTAPKSPHLIIRGIGDRLGDAEPFVRRLLQAFGAVHDLQMPIKKAHLFVTMESADVCERIRDALGAVPDLAGRTVVVQYCKRRLDAFDGLADVCTTLEPDEAVPGLRFVRDFIDVDHEAALLTAVDAIQGWTELDLRGVAHFGCAFDYANNEAALDQGCDPIPAPFAALAERIHGAGLAPNPFDQLTVNRYGCGAGIPPHCDRHSAFADGIASVSLRGGTVITFVDLNDAGRRRPPVSLYLPPRSLFVMTGESRYAWKHTIRARQYDRLDGVVRPRPDRVSLTFRAVNRRRQCRCPYAEHCDRAPAPVLARPECDPDATYRAPSVEIDYVHRFYDQIADHFSSTRYRPWPLVEAFIKQLPRHALIADIGCGNGKYLSCVGADSFVVGFDRCAALIDHCRQRLPQAEVGIGDALRIPLRSAAFDAALSVAVLHHISNVRRRLLLLSELVRIVRPGGRILIVAWAAEQDRTSRRRFSEQDCFVPWQKTSRFLKAGDDAVVQRFCHVYRRGEIPELVAQVDGAEFVSETYDASNWLVTIRKRRDASV